MTPDKVIAEIAAGKLDGHLAEIQEAMRERVLSQATSMRWKITHPDIEVREDDLTLEEGEMIERITGGSWATIDPYSSAAECRAILAVCLQKRCGKTAAEAAEISGNVPITEAAGMLSTYEVTAGPLEESGPGETAGSTASL